MTLVAPRPLPDDTAAFEQLRGLLAVAHAVRSTRDLTALLEQTADVIASCLGYGAVVVNLYRPAWDDLEVVAVHGSTEARALLLGQTTSWDTWRDMLDERFERFGAYVIPRGAHDWNEAPAAYLPPPGPGSGPDAWHPHDALMVPLRSSEGDLLGVLSVDEPVHGQRPSDAELEVLCAVAGHAALAVEHAQATTAAARHRAAVEHLMRVSAQLSGPSSFDDMLMAVCTAVRDALGFQRVVVDLLQDDHLVPRAWIGWEDADQPPVPPVPLAALERVLRDEHEQEGCVVLDSESARALTPAWLHGIHPSSANGRGPHAWSRHWLLVVLRDRAGVIDGVLWVDDPQDRLRPTADCLQVLRAFANHAMSAIESSRQLARLRHLAEHDPLTGLRTRHDFEARLDSALDGAPDGLVSLLVCDLDRFKRVNEALGPEAGDDVLRRFVGLLSRCAGDAGIATRLGGEEFALVLPGASSASALGLAERLRLAVRREFAGFDVPIAISVGIATSGLDVPAAAGLLRAASCALYAAKGLGRDRCVVHDANTLELLASLRNSSGPTNEQLSAAMLLAETLDLRDGGTARHSQTVGRLAERTARTLGWDPARVERVRAAGVLHDIGKLGIADAVLHKPRPLDNGEWEEMRRHPEVGARILEHANLRDIAAWVLAHHERVDGDGYPHGLAAAEIPAEAQVLAVADAYEAMTADRPYRRGIAPDAAQAELLRCAGTQFDPVIVRALLHSLDDGIPTATWLPIFGDIAA